MYFGNSRTKFSYIIWHDCEPYGKNQCKKKEYNQHNLGFKEFINNDPLQIYVKYLSHYLNVTKLLPNPFLFLSIVKEFVITKSSVVEIQNLVVNPKSRRIKSKSKEYQFLFKYVSSKNQ